MIFINTKKKKTLLYLAYMLYSCLIFPPLKRVCASPRPNYSDQKDYTIKIAYLSSTFIISASSMASLITSFLFPKYILT